VKNNTVIIILLVALSIAVIITSCTNKLGKTSSSSLSKEESNLLNKVGFDKEVFQILKKEFNCKVLELVPDYVEDKPEIKGVYVTTKGENSTYKKVFAIKDQLKQKGYIIFISDLGYNENPYKIGIIKSNDKYDPLRFMSTNGINYDYDTNDVIEKLKEWDKSYGIEIIGSGLDFVEVKLGKQPKDTKAFSNEVYEYCPDSVDQGFDTIEALENYIKDTSRVYMWWD
jgi:hypothetical protein